MRIAKPLAVMLIAGFMAISCWGQAKTAPSKAAAQKSAPAQHGDNVVLNKADYKYGPVPNLPSCSSAFPVKGDPTKGPSMLAIKASPGCTIPWHWHSVNEHVMVTTGQTTIQMKDGQPEKVGPGGYFFMTARHQHEFKCVTACTGFVYSEGIFDIHYVDPAGKEIPMSEAEKKK